MAACNVNDLMAEASCFACQPPGVWPILELALLCQIFNAGGGSGGGSSSVQVYEGRDPAAPNDPTKAAVSFPVGGGSLTQWSVVNQAWE